MRAQGRKHSLRIKTTDTLQEEIVCFSRAPSFQILPSVPARSDISAVISMVSSEQKPPKGLPPNFVWGFATAAYQIEGGVNEGGRGPCIWDKFMHLEPSRTKGVNGDVACDHYHRLEEDLDLLAKYGARAYRFSIAWSRIIPLGGREDPVSEEGVAFYNSLINGLLARGIQPWITLYHWDLPQALHERYGGWLNVEEVQKDFERYARVCFERFGDRTKNWITLNEPWIVSIHVSNESLLIFSPLFSSPLSQHPWYSQGN
jgi:beta-glucosidase